MTKAEQIAREALGLSEYQLEATLDFIRSMKADPFYFSAPPDAIASIELGRQQLARGEGVSLEEAKRRLGEK